MNQKEKTVWRFRSVILGGMVVGALVGTPAWAVTSRIHRHDSFKEFSEGEGECVIIESRGGLRLGRSAEVVADSFDQAWSINCITIMGGAVYFGTSPNGEIHRYNFGERKQLYPAGKKEPAPGDTNSVDSITNEHIFAMATDLAGRLLAGISGADCRLDRFGVDGIETIFRPQDAQYIFALAADDKGHLYIGTGPKGKIYQLDALGKVAKLITTCRDNNILSLAVGPDGMVYAGSDGRGLIYRINPRENTTTVLYDSLLPEITGLQYVPTLDQGKGGLYALATSAKIVDTEVEFATRTPLPGRPEAAETEDGPVDPSPQSGGQQFNIAGQNPTGQRSEGTRFRGSRRVSYSNSVSGLWRVSPEGYVDEVASQRAVLFCMAPWQDELLIGTGNEGKLLRVNPKDEQVAVLYEDEQATQVTAVATCGEEIYVGTANPARLVRLSKGCAQSGTYLSALIDADQPAHWGRLQLDADMPEGCQMKVSCRSGNVADPNDPTFSPWTDPITLTDSVPLSCPLGRFLQYKLIMTSPGNEATPFVREVAVASSIPNLAPVIQSVDFVQSKTAAKQGLVQINYQSRDANDDTLVFSLLFRQQGRHRWIELVKDHDARDFEWDTRTVEDGRYEVKVVACDALSNTPATALTGSRVSHVLVVDNTGPVVQSHRIAQDRGGLSLSLVVTDRFSAITKLDYTVNSDKTWHGAIPEDLVYDTTTESFTIRIDNLDPGEHVIAIRIKDGHDNVTYQSFAIEV